MKGTGVSACMSFAHFLLAPFSRLTKDGLLCCILSIVRCRMVFARTQQGLLLFDDRYLPFWLRCIHSCTAVSQKALC